MKCAKCKSEHNIKNGVLQGVQRYKCKDCGFNFTVEIKRTAKPEDVKRQALLMYLEGLGFHSIGRILKVSHVSVLNWVKKYGSQVDPIRSNKPVKIMEIDELHTCFCGSVADNEINVFSVVSTNTSPNPSVVFLCPT